MTSTPGHLVPLVRRLGLSDYESVWRDMQRFVEQRSEATPDELWVLQHPPVYTQGLNCAMSPLRGTSIPVVKTDRGGQITYHGPGQIIVYALIDTRRRRVGVKRLVNVLEQSVIDLLSGYGIRGERKAGAPGVYVDGRKIAALGIRIRRGCSYHGLSLNADMDLTPFQNIDPCGCEDLDVTQLRDIGVSESVETIEDNLARLLLGAIEAPPVAAEAPAGC